MELKYSLNTDDMLDLNLFRLRSIPELAKRQKMLRWGYLVVMLFLTLLLYSTGIGLTVCLLMAAILIGFFFYFPQYQTRQLRRMIIKDYKDPARAAALENRSAVTGEEGIELTTIKGQRKFAWGDFELVERTDKAVFILLKDKSCFTIDRARVSEGDYDQFVEEITEKSGKGRIIDLPAA